MWKHREGMHQINLPFSSSSKNTTNWEICINIYTYIKDPLKVDFYQIFGVLNVLENIYAKYGR